jgi:di/tricarboxylate transporter
VLPFPQGEQTEMTPDMILTMAVLVFVILVFIFEWVRVDVVGIVMIVLLPLIGLIKPEQAFVGLSSNAVCSIIAVIIIGAGLDRTGLMNRLSGPIIKLAGKSEKAIIILISGTVGLISSMMQNIGAAALFLPATQRISKRIGASASRILMPMGFCAIIGGTLTLVGASPTILLNDLIEQFDETLEPLGLFTQTPIGICLLLSAITYFVLFGKWLLPSAESKADMDITASLLEAYQALDRIFEIHVPEGAVGGKTLADLKARTHYLVTVVGINHSVEKDTNLLPRSYDVISPGDDVAVVGREKNIRKMAEEFGWVVKGDIETFAETLSRTNAGMCETIVSPRSELIGRTLNETDFKGKHGVNPIGVVRSNRVYYTGFTQIKLQMGDTLLLQGPWANFHRLKNRPQPRLVSFSTPLEGEITRPHKAQLAVFWLAVSLSMVIFIDNEVVPLSVALMTGALGMIVTGVLSIDEAYRSVDWMTVFLLAGLIPLGLAFKETGTAAFVANGILGLVGTPPPIVLLAIVGILTSFFTLVTSNVGATVLLVPICMTMAMKVGVDPRMAALVVGLSASNTFVLPTHQVNALIMRPGQYRTADYAKAGAGMTLIFLAVELAVIYFFYGVSASGS